MYEYAPATRHGDLELHNLYLCKGREDDSYAHTQVAAGQHSRFPNPAKHDQEVSHMFLDRILAAPGPRPKSGPRERAKKAARRQIIPGAFQGHGLTRPVGLRALFSSTSGLWRAPEMGLVTFSYLLHT
jgi:hypothetical protein